MNSPKSKFYISTAIDYVNAQAHLGHALEKIQADTMARYQRMIGGTVFYLTGTDEHSLSTIKIAQGKKVPIKEFVHKQAEKFKSLREYLNLSTDDFIRTSEKRHEQSVQKLWTGAKKDIYQKKYKGLFCASCEAYFKEEEAPQKICPVHDQPLDLIEEKNYFFKLSRYQKQIRKVIESDQLKIVPESRKNEVLGFIDQGLEDICISRSADRSQGWGIDVPGDKNQKVWCWFDALTNYISALDYGKDGSKFKKWWTENPMKVHCIGKDILRFHAVYWPAFLMAAGLPLPQVIFTHGFLSIDGQKMSKSKGIGVDPIKLVKEYGPDAVRYFLLREIPSTKDGDFSLAKFKERYNADLASGLGNLVSRVVKLANEMKVEPILTNMEASEAIEEVEKEYHRSMAEYDFREALMSIWSLIAFCDQYIEQEEPWKKEKGSEKVVANLLFIIGKISNLLGPFLPEASEKIKDQLQDRKKTSILFPRLK